ncbi:hypothetical protein Trco_004604 [Trichoderma cornu-damae]|uniref:Glycoside hydrolase family 125 protein n=1 Tax=Trichoderma cornu-damae TaxID=654480 RepID=A0A9P8QL44_9HYPO|nr:hypothetical protein Trco_004604 [Trichoderma cornu-damae]
MPLHASPQAVFGAALGLLAAFPAVASAGWQSFQPQRRIASSCPDYSSYSEQPHGPYSSGPLKLPYMRPSEECRTFKSPAAEKVVSDLKSLLKDPDLARLFENTFPSTLDTTVKYFDPTQNLAFIITGFAHLYKLLPYDKNLQALVKAVINTEARYISQYPYCGSFQPPPESGLAPTVNDWATGVRVNPYVSSQSITKVTGGIANICASYIRPVNNQTVFECKYELDSLAGFLKITRSYYANTKDSSFINDNWNAAVGQIVRVLYEQSQSSWSSDFEWVSYYNWTGTAGALSPMVPNGGNGEPKQANGLVASSHRPSDDLCVFNFITSDNAMMSVELANIADMLTTIGTQRSLAKQLRQYSDIIKQAVWAHTRTSNGIFAYETNGLGAQYIMDDANVPSLVSLPYLGFLERSDATYQSTKAAMFSRANPYYAAGKGFNGIGGPHVSATYPWPMSQISAIFGTDSDDEIKQRLAIILENTSGLGLIHESVNIYNTSVYTRPWFAWANSYFAEMVLDLAERKPSLILKSGKPYKIGQ